MMKLKELAYKYKNDIILLTTLTTFLIIFNLNFSVLHIRGSSMNPTYQDRDILIMKNVKEEKTGDIVVFSPPKSWDNEKDNLYIKRIVGLPGDKITINSNSIIINDKLIKRDNSDCNFYKKTFEIDNEHYLVMGDNMYYSNDSINQLCSNNSEFLIPKDSIINKGNEVFLMEGIFK